MQVIQLITLAEVHVKLKMILMDLLGPDNSSTLWKKRTSFASWTSAFEVPDWSSVWNELVTKKLPMVSSSLNEISGDCEKIVYQCYIPKLPGKQQQFEMLSNTPKLSAMDEGHEQPDSPEVRPWETY